MGLQRVPETDPGRFQGSRGEGDLAKQQVDVGLSGGREGFEGDPVQDLVRLAVQPHVAQGLAPEQERIDVAGVGFEGILERLDRLLDAPGLPGFQPDLDLELGLGLVVVAGIRSRARPRRCRRKSQEEQEEKKQGQPRVSRQVLAGWRLLP